MTYVGVTGRKFSTRLKEHETSQRLKDDKSLFRKHTNDEQHKQQHNRQLHNIECET